ncbi:gluconate 2-dehydrogenase subunit 3 family protein [Rhodoferax sp.]|uniref:gluconate 2-dehydrogenase subunit 3 family protein n=1 Tax=Rhodoferax sp. TaxID=50421 RepID=UPI0025FE2148|nr:gluconate 2-dehydrogenase subunit 3 family protein [Rhodoferax sp.]
MKTIGISPSRRSFLRGAVKTAPAMVALGGTLGLAASGAADSSAARYSPSYFNAPEWALLSALVERLIPADSQGPGATEAGVAEFIDQQMGQPYGFGALWFMQAPFVPTAADEFGYQLAQSPRDLYRQGLAALAQAVQQQHGKPFAALAPADQDAVLTALEAGKLAIGAVPPKAFFSQLLTNTREGYFCDPKHGGNRDMAAWRMVGFPGARGDYIDWVDQYATKYPLPPVSSS